MSSPPGKAAIPSTANPSTAAAAQSTVSSTAPAMAAPSIPNLLGRRGGGSGPPRSGRGGRRGLGRGSRGDLPPGHPHQQYPPQYPPQYPQQYPTQPFNQKHSYGTAPAGLGHNAIIQSTDTDAALSRLSAVDVGLLDDPFAQFFAGDGGPAPRRLPIINRGKTTQGRTQGLDKLIEAFLSGAPSTREPETESLPPPPVRQVVCLGAGTDTRSLRLLTQGQKSPRTTCYRNVIYHEIDFPSVSARKRSIVQSVPAVNSLLVGPVTQHSPLGRDGDDADNNAASSGAPANTTHRSWHAELGNGNSLWGHGLDLRELAAAGTAEGGEAKPADTVLAGLRTDVPTLLVSECCLCYLQPKEATSVLQWFSTRLAPASPLGVIVYEPVRPNDAFGRTMVANLAARGIEMPTVAAYPDGAAQEARLRQEAGLTLARHRTIDDIWDAWVPEAEQDRVNQLEGLDEVEEWKLLASHYVVAWGSRGAYFESAWAEL